MKRILMAVMFAGTALAATGQPLLSKYDNRELISFERYIYSTDSFFHSSVRPFSLPEMDSVFGYYKLLDNYNIQTNKKWKERLLNNNLIIIKGKDYTLTVDPLFDFGYGYDFSQNRSQWINTRGILIEGNLGKDFAFSTSVYETQARLPLWVMNYISRRWVVPGQGWFKSYGNGTALDFANASGYVSWSPGKFFNIRAGHGKNFLGDGYRSLLLSDCSYYYPYLMITTTFWKIKYINLYTQYSHPDAWWTTAGDKVFKRKFASTHYLSIVPWNNLNISLFESVIWKPSDSTYHRGFDFNYLNPIIFFRPVEFNLGSADNEMLGVNLRYTPFRNFVLYGQFVLDEFKFKEFFSSAGWRGNKYAWQAGLKIFSPFGIENLMLQPEFNLIRPYTYSHINMEQNYSNAREPLAHPAGANIKEAVAIARYNYKRLFINAKYVWAATGLDTSNINFGKNIFSTYTLNAGEYGNHTTQGRYTTLSQLDLSVSLLINPSTNMNLFLSATLRRERNEMMDNRYSYLSFGIRTSLRNIYYDFY